MYWRIDKDHLWEEGDSLPPRTEYGRTSSDPIGEVFEVRLLDDDRIPYYEGVSDDDGMEDMLNFGMTDAGCTILQVRQNGEWHDELN